MYVRFSPCVCWFVFLTSWFLNTVRVVFCFYLKKSARCNGRNVVEFFFNKYYAFVFVEVLLASDFTRRTMNFKINISIVYEFVLSFLVRLHFNKSFIYLFETAVSLFRSCDQCFALIYGLKIVVYDVSVLPHRTSVTNKLWQFHVQKSDLFRPI